MILPTVIDNVTLITLLLITLITSKNVYYNNYS